MNLLHQKNKALLAIAAAGVLAISTFASVLPASAGESTTSLDQQLSQKFWSQTTAPTAEQAQARTNLSVEAKQALLKTVQQTVLNAADREALKNSGLESFDPANQRIVTTPAVTTPAPVTAEALAALDAKMTEAGLANTDAAIAGAGCWVTSDEVQAWGITQNFGWKRAIDWCANGSVVTSLHRDKEEPGYVAPWWYYRGADNAVQNDVGGWQVQTYRRARFENCPPVVGCGANVYPSIEFTIRGDSSWNSQKGGI